MYSRLKKRKTKITTQLKKQRQQKAELSNFPSILSRQDSVSSTFNKSQDTRRRIRFRSNKKLIRPDFQPKSFASSNLVTQERRKSKLSNTNLHKSICININVSTKSWCLFDSENKQYFGFREDYQRQIASLTKIMTTFLSLQLIQSFQLSICSKVKISQTAASMIGTSAQLKQNHWVSLQDLLYGTMLPSGNDAAYVLAEYMGYLLITLANNPEQLPNLKRIELLDITNKSTSAYVQEFINQMNKKAKKIGLLSTRFSNPHGLQNAMNVSNAKDIVLLSFAATQNCQFKAIMNAVHWKYTLYVDEQGRKKMTKLWWNTNKLLYKDWQGVKTGLTNTAGSCLSSLKRGIYIVVLNSQNPEARFNDTQQIFSWYMKNKKKDCLDSIGVHLKASERYKTECNRVLTSATQDSI